MEKEKEKESPVNPLDKRGLEKFPVQHQEAPGLQKDMDPVPDSGEKSYRGHGRLKGRKALITGGDSGIGRAIAIAYAREGADVAVNFLPQEEKDADSLKELLEGEGRRIILVPGDLAREEECHRIVKGAEQELGGLDILVLNAGVQTALRSVAELTTEQLRHTFEVNVFSLYWTVQAALPYLKPGSSIIFTSSSEYFKPSEKLIDYAASKYAVIGFSRALAKELIKKGIRVNAVCPGPVWTPLEISGGLLEEDIPKHGEVTLMQRAAQPVELAGVYVFLASDEASFVTCETYGVAGGMHTV